MREQGIFLFYPNLPYWCVQMLVAKLGWGENACIIMIFCKYALDKLHTRLAELLTWW